MAKLLDMPKLSPTMEEGVLSAWHKKEGDNVEVDDLLAEVETDKATMEFRAFDKGTLLRILVEPGTNVKLGQSVAILGNAGDDVTALLAKAGASAAGGGAVAGASEAATGPVTQAAPVGAAAFAVQQAAPPVTPTVASAGVAAGTTGTAGAAAATVASPRPATPPGSVLSRTERAPDGLRAAAPGENGENGAAAGSARVLASPFVRKTARDRGLDLAGAHGSGPGGRVLPADLDQLAAGATARSHATERGGPANGAVANGNGNGNGTGTGTETRTGAGSTALARAPGGTAVPASTLSPPEVRPLSPMRKTIARRLSESKRTVPHFYLTIDVDAGKLVELREQINRELAGEGGGASSSAPPRGGEEAKPLKVSVNDLLLKAVAGALARVPECNAQFTEEAILIHTRIDVSVAVAVPEGLVTPVVRNADRKSVVAIAREVRELAARARAKKLKPEEMSDGTFSVSNLGMFGIDEFAAVINPPEGAILAVGQVREAPVVRDGAVVAGKRLSMTLSCDHRVIDGAVGASFLAELRALIEHPMRVLTG